MTITDKMVYQWDLSKGYEERTPFTHGFPKLPVLYAYRPEPYCKKIKTFGFGWRNYYPIMQIASIIISSLY